MKGYLVVSKYENFQKLSLHWCLSLEKVYELSQAHSNYNPRHVGTAFLDVWECSYEDYIKVCNKRLFDYDEIVEQLPDIVYSVEAMDFVSDRVMENYFLRD